MSFVLDLFETAPVSGEKTEKPTIKEHVEAPIQGKVEVELERRPKEESPVVKRQIQLKEQPKKEEVIVEMRMEDLVDDKSANAPKTGTVADLEIVEAPIEIVLPNKSIVSNISFIFQELTGLLIAPLLQNLSVSPPQPANITTWAQAHQNPDNRSVIESEINEHVRKIVAYNGKLEELLTEAEYLLEYRNPMTNHTGDYINDISQMKEELIDLLERSRQKQQVLIENYQLDILNEVLDHNSNQN
ncbi:hypothetical protein PCE1_003945 [Barthelona sp. PCE]